MNGQGMPDFHKTAHKIRCANCNKTYEPPKNSAEDDRLGVAIEQGVIFGDWSKLLCDKCK